jgi:hypothetical protein
MRILGVYRVYTLRSRRGMVLITTIWIVIALTAVVLVLCREMAVEAQVTRQHLAQARADAAEIGAEQYVMSVVQQELLTPGYKDSASFEQRQIGECYFWVLTYNIDDPDEATYKYGITDEASKVDINTWPVEALEYLPGMDQYPNLASQIVDWRDPDDLVTISDAGGEGAESNDYMATFGYPAKNGPFETVEELRLLADADDLVLHGADLNHNGVIDPAELASMDASFSFESSKVGILPFVTTYGLKATNLDTTSTMVTGNLIYSPIQDLNLTDNNQNPITAPIDVNNSTASAMNGPLQLMLNQVLGQRATAIRTATANITSQQANANNATANMFTSVFDWAIRANVTSQELAQIYPYLDCRPLPPPNNSTNSAYTQVGRLNITTASRAALLCLPGLEETDVDTIIAEREEQSATTDANGNSQVSNIAWLMDFIDPAKLQQAGKYITGSSTIFSADIVTVSQDGRAFKRVKIVVDASSGTPLIVYRRDMTDAGWPLDPGIREALRKGEPLPGAGMTDGSTPGSRLSAGVR